MNIAVVLKTRVTSRTKADVIEESRHRALRQPLPDLVELSFYHSVQDAKELYLLSSWRHVPDAVYLQVVTEAALSQELEIIEQSYFAMLADYRLLSSPVGASHLRVMTFPSAEDQQRYQLEKKKTFVRAKHIPGVVGCWLGCGLTDQTRLLHQTNWLDQAALQTFFSRPNVAAKIAERRSEGIKIEYASYTTQGLALPFFSAQSNLLPPQTL